MPNLIPIDSNVPAALESGWEVKDNFKDKNTKVEFNGRTYLVQDKHILKYSGFEKFCRGLLGALACLFSLGFASLAKPVRRLFSKDAKESKVFAYLQQKNSDELLSELREKLKTTPTKKKNLRKRLEDKIGKLEEQKRIADVPNSAPQV